MKIITTLLILINSFLYNAYCQNQYNPPRKSNTVVLLTEGQVADILVQFARHLQDKGYSIERLDKDLLSVSTDFKELDFPGVAVMKVNAFLRENEGVVKIEIKGKIEVTSPYGGQVPYEACNCGLPGDVRKIGLNTLLNNVESFSYKKLEFLEK